MFQLPEQDQQRLLRIARDAVKNHLSGRPECVDACEGATARRLGVFVSLHTGLQLRGCIGNIEPVEPLYRTTARCAVAAAVSDPRFAPLTLDELPGVSFEISVLGGPEPAHGPEDIEIGRHGLIVSKGRARGLLLPQVASQYALSPLEFLAETCRKAGLAPQAWRDGAFIHRFTAHVFGEESLTT